MHYSRRNVPGEMFDMDLAVIMISWLAGTRYMSYDLFIGGGDVVVAGTLYCSRIGRADGGDDCEDDFRGWQCRLVQ